MHVIGNCSCVSKIQSIHGHTIGNCSCVSKIQSIPGHKKAQNKLGFFMGNFWEVKYSAIHDCDSARLA